ncbi:MAG: hypothetical protein WAS27_00605 [Candidatus Saccharimonadales bacterium]
MPEPSLKVFSDTDLAQVVQDMYDDSRYGVDNGFTQKSLEKYPDNTDSAVIAMKIAIVDMENSTQLSRLLGEKGTRNINLKDIVSKIQSMPFDERVASGDLSLVSELSRWSSGLGLNLFSFFSKYCTYHNTYVYHKDDFSIFDKVVKEHIGDYLSLADCREFFGSGTKLRKGQTVTKLVDSKIESMRQSCDYEQYVRLVDFLLQKHSVVRPNKRRELDWFIWYRNR